MPRDDDFEDDRPRRRGPRDDEDDFDRLARPRRRRDDDDFDRRPPPRRKSNLGLILGIVGGVVFLLCAGAAVGMYFLFKGATTKIGEAADRAKIGEAAGRAQSSNNLKQIGLAIHEYNGRHGDLPNNTYSPDGKPLLSWRVHLLPFLGEEALYRQFKLDEPWDSPNNRRLLDQMPAVYATPEERKISGKGTKTYYRGFSHPGALFARRNPGQRLGLMNVQDGLSNTILVVEARAWIEWTAPDDLDGSAGRPFPPLGGVRPDSDVVMVLFGDGSVRAIRKTLPEAQWRGGTTYAGGEGVLFD